MSSPPPSPAIAVIGLGCHFPGARTPGELWENVLARRRQFRRFLPGRLSLEDYYHADPDAPDRTYGARGAFIDGFVFDWQRRRVPQRTMASTDTVHWLALEVAFAALADAGYDPAALAGHERAGVLVGNTLTGEFNRAHGLRLRWPYVRRALRQAAVSRGLSEAVTDDLVRATGELYLSLLQPITEDTLAGSLSNTIAGRICNRLDLKGGGFTVDGACASSLLAVAGAAEALCDGRLDLALAGGVDISLDAFELVGFAKTAALSPGEMSVYDRRASGFIPGEGCGFVVLKRLADAEAAGDAVYAVLRGWGISSDGRGAITAPDARGQALALRRAYARAGYAPGELAFIEGHGTGTPVGDPIELKAMALAMEDAPPPPRSVGVTSFKSLVGHTKAAAGIGGLIKTVLAVHRRVVPPTAGCLEPHAIFDGPALPLYPVRDGVVHAPGSRMRAGVSAMGFGGINCHVTLESGSAPSSRHGSALSDAGLLASGQESELFLLAAPDRESLARRVAGLLLEARHLAQGDLADLAAHLAERLDDGLPVRAALVAGEPDELGVQLEALAGHLAGRSSLAPSSRAGAFFGERSGSVRVGLLFPGQGSQQLNMARALVRRFDWAAALFEQAEEAVRGVCPSPLRAFVERPLDRARDEAEVAAWSLGLAQTEVAQPAICLASALWLELLRRMGVEPSAVGGHSLGELSAAHAAGWLDLPALLRLAAERGAAMARASGEAGAMASLACGAAQAEELLAGRADQVVIANLNAPAQTVISGRERGVEQVLVAARGRGIAAVRLRVSQAFHSPLMAPAAEELRRLELLATGTPCCALLSAASGTELAPGTSLRDYLAHEVTARVDFPALLGALAARSDLLLEVGPGRVLTGLVADCGGPVLCYPVESKAGRDGDLHRALAALFCRGGRVRATELFAGRLLRPYVAPAERVFLDNPCERPFSEAVLGTIAARSRPVPEVAPELALPGLARDELAAYLARRGEFLSEVIRADLRHGATELPAAGKPASIVEGEVGAPATASIDSPSESPVLSAAQAVGSEPPVEPENAQQIILELIETHTGFPLASIDPSARLLDDLNLDSIKGAQLMAAAARRLGLRGQLENPARFARATVGEVIAVFQGLVAARLAGQTGDGAALPGEGELLARLPGWVRHFVARLEPAPRVSPSSELASPTSWHLVLAEAAEGSAFATELGARLSAAGARVTRLDEAPIGGETVSGSAPTHLVILGAAPDPTATLEAERLRTSAALLHRGLQAFARLSAQQPVRVVCLERGGGASFAARGDRVADPWSGGALGLAQSLFLETERPDVLYLDLPGETSGERAGALLLEELAGAGPFIAAVYAADGQRSVPVLELDEPLLAPPRECPLAAEDVVLVTGGAKGITAECALALGRESGARFALVGSTPLSEEGGGAAAETGSREVRETLARFAAEGQTARYFACDVTDRDALGRLIRTVEAELGPIRGVLHGAGRNVPRRAAEPSLEEVLAEVGPKLLGALHLGTLLSDRPLKLFWGLSSIIGVTGLARNAWYAWSNELLQRLLHHLRARFPAADVLCVAFGLWDEVGMGVKLGSLELLRSLGLSPISVEEGTRRLLYLLRGQPPAHQVVIAGRTPSQGTVSLARLPPPTASERFLETILTETPGVEVVAQVRLRREVDLYLEDHRYGGALLFPTVFGLEAMAQVAARAMDVRAVQAVTFEALRLEQPIVVDPEGGTRICIRAEVLERLGAQAARAARVTVGLASDPGRPAFSATVVFGAPSVGDAATVRPSSGPAGGTSIVPRRDVYGPILFHGPLFQRLASVEELDSRHARFTVEGHGAAGRGLEGFAPGTCGPLLLGDPFLRDALLQVGQLLSPQEISLPVGIDRVTRWPVSAATPVAETTRLHGALTLEAQEGPERRLTVALFTASGELVERLEGYRVRVLRKDLERPTAEALANGTRSQELHDQLARAYDADPSLELLVRGPTGRRTFVSTTPLDFRELANLNGGLYFSHLFARLGQLRERALMPLFGFVAQKLQTGQWGVATVRSEVRIRGDARPGDLLVSRLWLDGADPSSPGALRLGVDWQRAPRFGETTWLAEGTQTLNWVRVVAPGVVEPAPFPEELKAPLALLSELQPGHDERANVPREEPALDEGAELFAARPGGPSPLLAEETFATSLEDANLMGNIYFASYARWQGRLRDRFVYDQLPSDARLAGPGPALVCTHSRVDHLREALPFDAVRVSMQLARLTVNGFTLSFAYHARRSPAHEEQKVAVAEHSALWCERDGQGLLRALPLPAPLARSLLDPRR
ncbi:MAG: SDR family NAD(P)-dependent oxidoreductase [Deltaproteobacteria bacterium]|nr:SDR family NAD(P)-dependent oxidoreductase [Deltaproteobacteria bacterium]